MKWNNETYYRAFDHNYQVAYEHGAAFIDEGSKTVEERLSWLQSMLEKTGRDPTGTTLLDVGCGDGTNPIFLCELGYKYTGIDISEAAIETARRRIREANIAADLRVGDATDLGEFVDGTFDVVHDSYCFHMLVVDSHRKIYLEEVKRVLQKNGHFVLLTSRNDDGAISKPIDSFEDWVHELPSGSTPVVPHQKCINGEWITIEETEIYLLARDQSFDGYRSELTNAGFEIIHSDTWENDRKAVFICRKQ